jgi:hypothetical protein
MQKENFIPKCISLFIFPALKEKLECASLNSATVLPIFSILIINPSTNQNNNTATPKTRTRTRTRTKKGGKEKDEKCHF